MNISKLFENFLKEILGNIPEALIGEYLLHFIIFGGAFLFSVFAVCMVLCGKEGFFKLKSKEERKPFLFGAVAVAAITGFFAYDNFHKIEVEKTRTERSQEFQQNQVAEYSSPENISVEEPFEGSREDVEKFGRLVLCGYWEGSIGTDLNISTDRIVEINSKTYVEGESFLYSIRSISKNANEITVQATFSQGGTSFYADLIFKDMNNMSLKNYATNETSTYKARTKPYPQHLDNNLQYIFLYGHMGSGFYLDLETLQVVEDKTSWSFNVISANMNKGGQRRDIIPMKFSISIYDGKPFFVDKNQEIPLDINDTTSSNMLRRNAFLTSYYYAFGRNYGSRF